MHDRIPRPLDSKNFGPKRFFCFCQNTSPTMVRRKTALCISFSLCLFASSLNAQSAAEWSRIGGKALNDNKFDEAIKAFNVVISIDSTKKAWAFYHIGLALEARGALDQATGYFEKSLLAGSSLNTVGYRLARAYARTGKLEKAMDIFQKLIAIAPNDGLQTELAGIYFIQGKVHDGLKIYEEILRKNPTYPVSLVLPQMASRMTNIQDLRTILYLLSRTKIATSTDLVALTDSLVKRGLVPEAEQLWRNVLKNEPNSSTGYVQLVRLVTLQHKYVSLEDILPTSHEMTREHADACVQIADEYVRQDLFKQAEQLLIRILDKDDSYRPAQIRLLRLYYSRGHIQEGLNLVVHYAHYGYQREFLGDNPDPEWNMMAAKLYFREQKFTQAEDYAKKAMSQYEGILKDQPDYVSIYLKTAIAYLISGELANAERDLRKYYDRTTIEGRDEAFVALQSLSNEGIAKIDVDYLLRKYSASQKSEPKPAGNVRFTVVRDTISPAISVSSPIIDTSRGSFQTDSFSIRIVGYASDDNGVSIVYTGGTVAGLTQATSGEASKTGLQGKVVKFEGVAMLTMGENAVVITCIDVNGNLNKTVINVKRNPVATLKQEKSPTAVRLPKIWAVLVGISRYESKELQLQFADKDAQQFYGFLRSANGGLVSDDRIDLLTNRNATRSEIIRVLNEKLRLAYEQDEVIIYLACHGVPDEVTNELYFLGYDSDPKNIVGTGISQLDIEKAISSARAKKVLLIVDACHSGGLGLAANIGRRGGQAALTNKLLQELSMSRDGVAILSASSASEFSQEGPSWDGHGVFTYHLVKGLQGAGDLDKDGIVTIREVYEYVYRKVAEDTRGEQHPDLQGKYDNGLPVSVIE